jgi:DNA-binding IclR family transcriptional regulator
MHNMLATLEAERFVRRDARTRAYQLGPALISLGTVAEQQIKAVQLAAEALAPLAASEGISFATAHHTTEGTAQVIERFYPPRDVHVGVTLGARFGHFEGALGKCLLAALEPAQCERLIRGHSLPAHTERSITDTEKMLAEIETVRARGWAVSAQELNEVNAVAAPVFGPSGEPVLYLLGLGLVGQLREDGLDEMGERLHELAEEMTIRSGGCSPVVAAPTAG